MSQPHHHCIVMAELQLSILCPNHITIVLWWLHWNDQFYVLTTSPSSCGGCIGIINPMSQPHHHCIVMAELQLSILCPNHITIVLWWLHWYCQSYVLTTSPSSCGGCIGIINPMSYPHHHRLVVAALELSIICPNLITIVLWWLHWNYQSYVLTTSPSSCDG